MEYLFLVYIPPLRDKFCETARTGIECSLLCIGNRVMELKFPQSRLHHGIFTSCIRTFTYKFYWTNASSEKWNVCGQFNVFRVVACLAWVYGLQDLLACLGIPSTEELRCYTAGHLKMQLPCFEYRQYFTYFIYKVQLNVTYYGLFENYHLPIAMPPMTNAWCGAHDISDKVIISSSK